jgi:hypothetical protein
LVVVGGRIVLALGNVNWKFDFAVEWVCAVRARPRSRERESIFAYLTTRLDISKRGRDWRRKEVRIEFIESWKNVLNEECDI